MLRTHILLVCIISTMALKAQSHETTYADAAVLPDVTAYLPTPPDTASRAFAGDFMRWQWGKTLRADRNRGAKANQDTQLGVARTSAIYSSVLGFDIDSVTTPAIHRLLEKGGNTAIASALAAKGNVQRKRPFVQMNEHSWGDHETEAELRATSSYPSAHAAAGWATALLLAEIAGAEQNAIFFNGYDYGTSRVIAGANWQSDVEAGQLCGAAAVALMHNSPDLASDLAAARAEYLAQSTNATPNTTLPNGLAFIPAPADSLNRDFVCDIVNYWQAKSLRATTRGTQAIADADSTTTAYMKAFMKIIDIEPTDAPSLAQVITQATDVLRQSAREMKSARLRWRPYAKLNEPTLIGADEAGYKASSSHPSEAAQIGWGLALLMAEIAPAHQDQILQRGYEYGRSRIIAGYQYASDIAAGRAMAAAIVARLHAITDFATLLSAAKDEYITSVQP